MGGGMIQLAAYGEENMFITDEPQITFFKVAYRRHTNFTKEQIPQNFATVPNFGKIVNCIIAKNADLIGSIQLVVTLPKINISSTSRTTFAWVKRIGFALIKSVSVIINGYQIDKHYGDWLNLWAELTGAINGPHQRGYEKMIGDVDELTEFSHTKSEYTLFIPLQFWFCRNSGMALPLVSLQYSDVKINVEFEVDTNCYILTPTHYIVCKDDIVSFLKYEYIEQNIDGDIRAGIFIDYDIVTKRLYYYKITTNKLTSIPVSADFDTSNTTLVSSLESSDFGLKYQIIGKTTNFAVFAQLNSFSTTAATAKINNLKFVNCFLLVDYYFLDVEERFRFAQSRHDYLIDQLYYTPAIEVDDTNRDIQLVTDNPSKLMVWTAQMKYIFDSKDYYNYTDTYQNKVFKFEPYEVPIGDPIGKNIVLESTIMGNGNERLTLRNASYFEYVQQFQNTKYTPQVGINMYSYALYPFTHAQPSGSFNTSQIDNIEIRIKLSNVVNVNNVALFRGYSLCQNILRIVNGYAAPVFTR
jgi:Major capsid protein N-terminus/Large eukaryotic DNA virus major capsid protein